MPIMDILKGGDHSHQKKKKKKTDFWRKSTEVPRERVDHPEKKRVDL
jgi:hypothetical protein